jgi:hypothetical protein
MFLDIARRSRAPYWSRSAGIVLALLNLCVGTAASQAPAKVFDACYVPPSGVVYRIKEPGLSPLCFSPAHVPFSWIDGVLTRSEPNGFAVTGTLGAGTIPVQGPGVRLMWYPAKAAFRAGGVPGTEWDDGNIGRFSTALGEGTTASGGWATAMGPFATASGMFSTALGDHTAASGQYSTAMGVSTTASGLSSTATGEKTTASGFASTAMGVLTTASGDYSTAMGSTATAGGRGSFVYGDFSGLPAVTSGGENRFVVRASGGTAFYSNGSLDAGVTLSPGASAWASVSDVKRKEHFRAVDGAAVLEKIARMPIREWSYKAQDPSIRHLGPTAQDFHVAFGLGESDTTITTTDIDGINLVAVQALERRTREQAREIAALRAELAALRAEISLRR